VVRYVPLNVGIEYDERMVTPTQHGGKSPPRARREQIVQAARAAIEEHGPDALTSQIAQRAGLARPNVYRHFASKDDLDLEVARCASRELREEVRKRLDVCGSPLDVVRAPIAVQVIWADRHPNLYHFLVSRGYPRSARRREAERWEYAVEVTAAGARYFPRFADNPAAADLIVGLGGLIDASILDWLTRRTETCEQLVGRLTTQVWLIVDHHLRDVGVCLDPDMPLPQLEHPQS
jgi:AcrR family transcriptional regulator